MTTNITAGKYIIEQQVSLYMKYRENKFLTQAACAAKIRISTKSGYIINNSTHYTMNFKFSLESYFCRGVA